MTAQAPTTETDSAARLRRASKRLLNAQRDFNRELARFHDELAAHGIKLEITDHGPKQGEGDTK